MKRLTREVTIITRGKEAAVCNYKNDDCNDYCIYGTCRWQEKANMLLKKYEDTGLTPEQIIKIQGQSSWIPVEDRLPEERINPITNDFYEYQVTAKFGEYIDVRHYKFGRGHWWHGPSIVDKYVIAWQPLPEPYEPKEGI